MSYINQIDKWTNDSVMFRLPNERTSLNTSENDGIRLITSDIRLHKADIIQI